MVQHETPSVAHTVGTHPEQEVALLHYLFDKDQHHDVHIPAEAVHHEVVSPYHVPPVEHGWAGYPPYHGEPHHWEGRQGDVHVGYEDHFPLEAHMPQFDFLDGHYHGHMPEA
jgi:hypothetical protein